MKQLIEEFQATCHRWNEELASLPEPLVGYHTVFNERLLLQDPAKISYILIGDNPGTEEQRFRQYFVGGAGMKARLFFERYLVQDFDTQVLCLNKTPIHTNTTAELKAFLDDRPAFLRSTQTYMADLALKLHERAKKKIPIVVCGFGDCRQLVKDKATRWSLELERPKIATYFFNRLRGNFQGSADQLFLIKHFSRDQFFDDFDIQAYWNDPEARFFEIGRKYRNELLG